MRVRAIAALMATSALTFAVPALAETPPASPAAPAAAQDQAVQGQPAPAQTTPDVVVTGTRIVRDGYTAPTPVTVATTDDLLKSTPSGVPDALRSCHTTIIDGAVVEGHAPAADIKRFLAARPKGMKGIAVAGMPLGTPGMEAPGRKPDRYSVVAFGAGRQALFAKH